MEFGNSEIKPLFIMVMKIPRLLFVTLKQISGKEFLWITFGCRSPILHPPGNLHFVKLPPLLFMFFSSLVNFIVVQRHS